MIMHGGGTLETGLFAYCIQEDGAPPPTAEEMTEIKRLYSITGRTIVAEDLSIEMAARLHISNVRSVPGAASKERIMHKLWSIFMRCLRS